MATIGRPKDEHRQALRALMTEMSDRTFARYYKAVKSIYDYADAIDDRSVGYEIHKKVNSAATRPNGSLNVTRFAEAADDLLSMHYVDLLDEAQKAEESGTLDEAPYAVRVIHYNYHHVLKPGGAESD